MGTQEPESPGAWQSIQQLIHLRRFAFTAFLPLMGAATAVQRSNPAPVLVIVLMAFQFHIFTYVLNDVIDLPVDRLMPKRKYHPLVRGEIRRGTALALALVQIPLMLLTGWLARISLAACGALLAAIICMSIYDVWGKRLAFPGKSASSRLGFS